jgi:hypothetical protein
VNNKNVKDIKNIYLGFYWIIFLILIIYWYMHSGKPIGLYIMINSFNLFVLPYMIVPFYIFKSVAVKKKICRDKSINTGISKAIPKIMHIHYFVLSVYMILVVCMNIFEFMSIKFNIVEAFFVVFISLITIFVSRLGIDYHLFYINLIICRK